MALAPKFLIFISVVAGLIHVNLGPWANDVNAASININNTDILIVELIFVTKVRI
jgi:hypothetical protein